MYSPCTQTHTHTHYWFANWPLFLEGKKSPRKEADPSKIGRYRFDKQKNFWKRLAFKQLQNEWTSVPAGQNLGNV